MARSTKRARTIVVKLFSSAMTGKFFVASRPRTAPKLAMMKHDTLVQRHVLFIEGKRSK